MVETRRILESIYKQLERLYARVNESSMTQPELLPSTLMEMGMATEELQVTVEDLYRKNQQLTEMLQQANMSRDYYQNLFLHSPNARLITNLEGKIEDANVAAARLLNLSRTAVIGSELINFIPTDWQASMYAELYRLRQSNTPRTWSIELQPRNGDLRNLLLTTAISTVGSSDGPQVHWVMQEMAETWNTVAPGHAATPTQPNDADLLGDRTHYTFSKGDVIPLNPQVVWIVRQGLVKLSTLTENNEDILLGLIGPSMSFSLGSIFLPVYQAIALSDVQLVRLSLSEVCASPALSQLVLAQMNQRSQQLENLLAIVGQRHVKERLCSLLRLLQREIGQSVEDGIRLNLRLTHEDLSSACCTTRVTMTRLLNELQRQNKIRVDSKSHIIVSHDF